MTAYRIELRRGPGLWLFPVLLAAGVIFAISRLETLDVWSYTTAAAANSPYLLGPFVAGVAAWLGARGPRRGTEYLEQTAARGSVRPMAVEILALATWVGLAYACVGGVLLSLTAGRAGWGGPEWVWLLASGLGLLSLVPIGYLLGRLLPWRFTPLLVAMTFFALFVVGDVSLNSAWERLLPVNVWTHNPFSDVRERPLYGQMLWYVAIGLWVSALLALRTRARLRGLMALAAVACVTTAGGVGLVSVDGLRFSVMAQNRHFVCSTSMVEVCVHPAFAVSLPRLQQRADTVAKRLVGTGFDVKRFEQQPRSAVGLPGPGAVAYAFDADVPRHYERAGYEMAMGALNAGPACFPGDGPPAPGRRAIVVIISWASGNRMDPADPARVSAWNWISSQPEETVREWIAKHQGAIRDCTLSYADFPA